MRTRNWMWGCIFISVLFLAVSGFAQQDTLILLGSNPEMGGYAVSAYNKHAFVPAYDLIRVADYSDPHNIDPVTSYPVASCMDMEIKDSLAYYVGDTLYITDISVPLSPQLVGWCRLNNSNWAFRIHLFDTLALAMYSTYWEECYLAIVDISNPENPQLLSTNETPTYSSMYTQMDAWKKDNYVYWVDEGTRIAGPPEYSGRVIVLDITDPTDPVPIVVDTCLPSRPSAIWIVDDYAYVALTNYQVDHGGLMVLDISDPYNIDSVGCLSFSQVGAYNLYISGNLVYVSARVSFWEGDGVYVLDITNPTNPSLVTYYHTPDIPWDVFIDEPYVLVEDYNSLLVFEASFLVPGDVNWDREVNSSDVIYLINYLFVNGPEPPNPNLADVNCDCGIDAADIVYLINYLFVGGPDPEGGCIP